LLQWENFAKKVMESSGPKARVASREAIKTTIEERAQQVKDVIDLAAGDARNELVQQARQSRCHPC